MPLSGLVYFSGIGILGVNLTFAKFCCELKLLIILFSKDTLKYAGGWFRGRWSKIMIFKTNSCPSGLDEYLKGRIWNQWTVLIWIVGVNYLFYVGLKNFQDKSSFDLDCLPILVCSNIMIESLLFISKLWIDYQPYT